MTSEEPRRCEQAGCTSTELVYCYFDTEDSNQPTAYYCAEHCKENGFCWACGIFFGGIDSFELNDGLCDMCWHDFQEDEDENENYDEDYDEDYM